MPNVGERRARGGALKALTDRQRRFVEEYMVDLNATQAAVRAGYSPRKTGLYTQLFGLPHVRAAVEAALAEKAERSRIDAERVLEELGKIAFANMLDYVRAGPDGAPVVDLARIERDAGAAIQRISIEYFRDGEAGEGRGAGGPQVRRVQVTLADKRAALREIARHLGLYRDKIELSTPQNRPIYVVTGVPRAGDEARDVTPAEAR